MATGACKDKMSEETFDFICTSCADGGTSKEAVRYCVECQGYCCQSCVDIHAKILVLKSHTLLDDLTSKSSQHQPGLPEIPTERCNIHKTKLLDMYCKQHDTVGCYVCFAENHKSCKGPHSIPESIDQLYTESAYKQISRLLRDFKANMETLTETSIQQLRDLKTSKENVIEEIKALRIELEVMLDKLEEQSLQEVEMEYEKIHSKKLKEQTDADTTVEVLRKVEDQMSQAAVNRSQRFVCMKLAEAKMAEVEQMKTEIQRSPIQQLDFKPHGSLTDLLQQLQNFGEINVSSTVYTVRKEIYKIKECKTINIMLPDDTSDCYSMDLCLTDDDMLLVTDYNNKRLKRFDINKLSFVDCCDFPNCPYCVCCVGQQEAAVTFYNNTVQFVKLDKSMTLSRKLELNHVCLGIAFDNQKLYITDNRSGVYMYDMSGTLLQKVTHDKAGNQIFASSRHITISKTADYVAVGGWDKGWACFDKTLNHIATYSDTDLQRTNGVCSDSRGNIFVVGNSSNNIVQFCEDGTKRGVIVTLSDEFQKLRSVCFHQRMNRLFVTMDSNNIVRVYDLQ